MTRPKDWCDDYSNVLKLAKWLIDVYDFDAVDLLRYFEKPWKWGNEYRLMTQVQGVACLN